MPARRSTLFRPLLAIAVMAATTYCAIAQQPPTPSRVRGTIEAVDGDVLALAAEGLSGPELAAELVLSPTTVNTHFKNIYAKLHVRSRLEALVKYLQ